MRWFYALMSKKPPLFRPRSTMKETYFLAQGRAQYLQSVTDCKSFRDVLLGNRTSSKKESTFCDDLDEQDMDVAYAIEH